jgi:hypothetical protein
MLPEAGVAGLDSSSATGTYSVYLFLELCMKCTSMCLVLLSLMNIFVTSCSDLLSS